MLQEWLRLTDLSCGVCVNLEWNFQLHNKHLNSSDIFFIFFDFFKNYHFEKENLPFCLKMIYLKSITIFTYLLGVINPQNLITIQLSSQVGFFNVHNNDPHYQWKSKLRFDYLMVLTFKSISFQCWTIIYIWLTLN